jgi:type II secretory pathway component GspD/PulD (secretin)
VPDYQLPYLDRLMAQLDRPQLDSNDGSSRNYVNLKHRDVFDPGIFDSVTAYGTPTVLLLRDEQNNALYLEDAPSGAEAMLAALAEIDVPTEQLEAVVKVYEVDVTDDGRLGLDYVSWKNGPGRNLFAVGGSYQNEHITSFDGDPSLIYDSGKGTQGLPGRQFSSGGGNVAYFFEFPSAFFDFLVAEGRARVMTESKLTALNRSTASLEIGDEILFFAVQNQNAPRGGSRVRPLDPWGDLDPLTGIPDGVGAVPFADQDFPDNRTVTPLLAERALGSVDVGFTFRMTPTIHSQDSEVALFLALVDVTGWSDEGTPVLASRTVDTIVNIPRDGREITIGGMVSQRRIDGAAKMPWLGDVPVLGYLFGGESRMDQKVMVVVTLSTRVVAATSTWTPEDS